MVSVDSRCTVISWKASFSATDLVPYVPNESDQQKLTDTSVEEETCVIKYRRDGKSVFLYFPVF